VLIRQYSARIAIKSDYILQDNHYRASGALRRGPQKPVNSVIATETISKLLKHATSSTPISKIEIQPCRQGSRHVPHFGIYLAQLEADLAVLCQKDVAGAFTPDIVEKILMRILPVVEKLECCRTVLLDELGEGDDVGVIRVVCEAVENRCVAIGRAFNELEGKMDAQTLG